MVAATGDDGTPGAWPAHGREVRLWRQTVRGGTREDRMLSEVTVWLPPAIAERELLVPSALAAEVEESLREIVALDASHGAELGALGTMLLRTESVASSKIEQVEADVTDYARALHGVRANPSAASMAAATVALEELIDSVTGGGDLTVAAVLRSHQALMQDDPGEAAYAGRFRDMQNWIGGSDHSPRNALYVPPPEDTVEDYMDDLVAFTNRDDLSALVRDARAAGASLGVVSAYRSHAQQASTFQYWVDVAGYGAALRTSARAGRSEHQLGTTLDFTTAGGASPWEYADWATTREGAWMAANAWRYGFVMSYPRGAFAQTCYDYEPWHLRYVGRELASDVIESGLSLREYLWQLNPVDITTTTTTASTATTVAG